MISQLMKLIHQLGVVILKNCWKPDISGNKPN